MSMSPQDNHLLRKLLNEDFDRIVGELELIEMPLDMVLHEPDQKTTHAYFPINSIVSLMSVLSTGATLEVALVGFEGMIGLSMLLGGETTTTRAIVQSAGWGYRIKEVILRQALEESPLFTKHLLRFIQALLTLIAQTAVCNRHHSVEQQVCRWLLMSLDRQPEPALTMTHELISNMLGVRREGVSEAAGRLQKAGYIQYSRGVIHITNRQGLEDDVCECYGVVRKEFDRLLNL